MICGIIGYRLDSLAERHPDIVAQKVVLLDAIRKMVVDGARTFYTAMNMGPEIWCANYVLHMKKSNADLRLVCVVSGVEPDEGDKTYRADYMAITDKADMVIHINDSLEARHQYVATHANILLDACNDAGYVDGIVEHAEQNGFSVGVVKPFGI